MISWPDRAVDSQGVWLEDPDGNPGIPAKLRSGKSEGRKETATRGLVSGVVAEGLRKSLDERKL